jgi:hypothetical protein
MIKYIQDGMQDNEPNKTVSSQQREHPTSADGRTYERGSISPRKQETSRPDIGIARIRNTHTYI